MGIEFKPFWEYNKPVTLKNKEELVAHAKKTWEEGGWQAEAAKNGGEYKLDTDTANGKHLSLFDGNGSGGLDFQEYTAMMAFNANPYQYLSQVPESSIKQEYTYTIGDGMGWRTKSTEGLRYNVMFTQAYDGKFSDISRTGGLALTEHRSDAALYAYQYMPKMTEAATKLAVAEYTQGTQ